MPLSGGTSGAHDDAMHQGNAKRDVVGGLAALDAVGNLLIPGTEIHLTRLVGGEMFLREHTSSEYVQRWRREGANDYISFMKVGGAWSQIQNTTMKDTASGIAALDAAGALLLPGSKMYYTRDGSDDVHIYERTSNEEAYAFHRVGADDYTFFVKESNVWKRMQTESMKDAANGIAGLDAGSKVLHAQLPYEALTEGVFRTNAATGTATVPANSNDNNTATETDFDSVNEYVEVDFGLRYYVSQYRQYGNSDMVGNGYFKIQHFWEGAWVDNTVNILVQDALAWSTWTALTTPVLTSKIRFVCTTVDTLGASLLRELEMK